MSIPIYEKSLKEYLERIARNLGGTIDIYSIKSCEVTGYSMYEIQGECVGTDMRQVLLNSVLRYKSGSLGTNYSCVVLIDKALLVNQEAHDHYWEVERELVLEYRERLASVDYGERYYKLQDLMSKKFTAEFDFKIVSSIQEDLEELSISMTTWDILDGVCEYHVPKATQVLRDYIEQELVSIRSNANKSIIKKRNELWDGKLSIEYEK